MNLNKPAVIKKLQERFRNVNAGRGLYTAFLVPTMLTMFSTRAFAADTIWTKASAIMQDVYTQILGISTISSKRRNSIISPAISRNITKWIISSKIRIKTPTNAMAVVSRLFLKYVIISKVVIAFI